jgi:hypothetical protein
MGAAIEKQRRIWNKALDKAASVFAALSAKRIISDIA